MTLTPNELISLTTVPGEFLKPSVSAGHYQTLFKILVVCLLAKISQAQTRTPVIALPYKVNCSLILLKLGKDDALTDTVSFFFISHFQLITLEESLDKL